MRRVEKESHAALKRWLSDVADFDVLATITLKQALPNEHGGLTELTRDECVRVARIVRDRVTKGILGNRRYRRGERIPFVPTVEGGDGVTRWHLHIAMRRPEGIDFDAFQERFGNIVQHLDWVHRIIDVRPISALAKQGSRSVIGYSLKEGSEAFLPEAASI